MNEKELAEIIKADLLKAIKEENPTIYAFSIPLEHEMLKNININLFIEELKKLKLYADYQKNIKKHRYSKIQKNCLFVSINPINN